VRAIGANHDWRTKEPVDNRLVTPNLNCAHPLVVEHGACANCRPDKTVIEQQPRHDPDRPTQPSLHVFVAMPEHELFDG
jgi:hypothetical protein